jgi:hypothetical protein
MATTVNLEEPSLTLKVGSYRKRQRTGTVTPNYHSVKSANLPINSYTDYQWDLSQAFCVGAWEEDVATGVRTQQVPPGYTQNSGTDILSRAQAYEVSKNLGSVLGWVDNALLVELLNKIADAKSNLPVTVAEAGKTSSLILDRASRLYWAYRSFRLGHFGDVAVTLGINPKNVHKTWLEYKYGWVPLLIDVKKSAEFFAQQQMSRPIQFTVKGRKTANFSWSDTTHYTANYGGDATFTKSLLGSFESRMKIRCEVTNPHLSALQQLGLTNPALVAWELVPYSFVFDWFISVGDYLQGLTALHGITVKSAMVSHTRDQYTLYKQPTTDGVITVGGRLKRRMNGGLSEVVHGRFYERSPLIVNPLSTYPPAKNSISRIFEKMTTSLALLKSNSRSFR